MKEMYDTRADTAEDPLPTKEDTWLQDYVGKLQELGGVEAVVVDRTDDPTLHVTTYIGRDDDDLRRSVYQIDLGILREYEDLSFDFHDRLIPRDANGKPQLPTGDVTIALRRLEDDDD